MAHISFTSALQRHIACPPCEVAGTTLAQALDQAFALYPGLRGYIVDEHGAVRKHIAIFVDGSGIADRQLLSDPVGASTDIWVMQALSGG